MSGKEQRAFRGEFLVSGTSSARAKLPDDVTRKLRVLAHDLSNSLETILQANYLLKQTKVDEKTRRWFDLIEAGTQEAARLTREIREILKAHR